MATTDLSRADWRTSSYSGSNGNCVEVTTDVGAWILLRDTKDRCGPILAFRPNAWRWFIGQAKAGTLPA
jgi:hypothetical protein